MILCTVMRCGAKVKYVFEKLKDFFTQTLSHAVKEVVANKQH